MMRPNSMTNPVVRAALLVVASTAFLLAACANYETPARDALTSVETSLQAVTNEAHKYAPDELKVVQDKLAAAKAKFAEGDFKAALLGARQLTNEIPQLMQVASRNHNELMTQLGRDWQRLSLELPKMIDAIGARLAKLGKSRSPPPAYAQAKTDFDGVQRAFNEAKSASAAGNVQDAVGKAKSGEEQAKSIMAALGIKPI
jgi:Domain of unknown function (DUF4398)